LNDLIFTLVSHVHHRAFEAHVIGVMDKLDQRLATIRDPRLRQIETIMANHGLVDASFQQLVLLCQAISPALGDVVKSIRASHSLFFNDIQKTSSDFMSEIEEQRREIASLHERIETSEIEIARLMDVADLLDKVVVLF
jgi:hypothetical protein